MEIVNFLSESQRQIVEVYKKHNLTSLRGIYDESEYKHDGINILEEYLRIVNPAHKIYQAHDQYFYFTFFSELEFISDEILHFTGLSLLYFPFLNNPLN